MTSQVMLTDRDLTLVRYLSQHKAAPLDVLAAKFFRKNPFSGKVNANPQAACKQRISLLKRAGYLRDAAGLILMTKSAARAAGVSPPPPVHARQIVHHAETLRASERVIASLEKRGFQVSLHLENEVRAMVQGGGKTRYGEQYDAFPDALLVATSPEGKVSRIALEYVTTKYSDALIAEKQRDFAASYDTTLWVSDKASTRQRVERLTGESCLGAA